MDVVTACSKCGGEIVLRAQAGGMFYAAFETDTDLRHVCPVVEAERAALAACFQSEELKEPPAPKGHGRKEKAASAAR